MSLFRTEVPAGGAVKQVEQVAYKDAEGAVHVLDVGEVVPFGWVRYIPVPPGITAGQIATRRWQAEVAGITVSGMQVDTGRDSQALITGAAVSAMLDPTYSVRWKTAAGFVVLNAEQIIGLASTVRAHVQACFDREVELLAELEARVLTEGMLEQGWP